jgi:hypothetical protein
MSVIETNCVNGLADDVDEYTADRPGGPPFPAPNAKLVRLPVAPALTEQRILAVEFRSPDGRHWHAIGGGTTVAAAIDWVRECCPDGTTWDVVSWEDLYGD